MANVLSEDKKQQVLALGRPGWLLWRIEQATGVRQETASAYLKRVGGGRGRGRATARRVGTLVGVKTGHGGDHGRPTHSPTASTCDPYRELIELGLARGRSAMAIWQDSVSEHDFAGGCQSVKRFVRQLRGTQTPGAHPVIVIEPRQEAQVDYSTGPVVRGSQTCKYRRTRLFVMTLGYNRKVVRLLVFRPIRAPGPNFLKKPFADNPLYRDVPAHYGVVAMPCRVRHPD